MTIAIAGLIDDAKCYKMVRESRWPDGDEYDIYNELDRLLNQLDRTGPIC